MIAEMRGKLGSQQVQTRKLFACPSFLTAFAHPPRGNERYRKQFRSGKRGGGGRQEGSISSIQQNPSRDKTEKELSE